MGLMETLEQKPEYLILGAVGVGVVLFMATNRRPQNDLPQASPPTQVTTTPATDTVSSGEVATLINQYQANEQQWILQQLELYYQNYNGQPPSYTPPVSQNPPNPDGSNQGGGRGGDTEAFYRWPSATAVGGDSPPATETFTGRRWETLGLRSTAGGY